MTAYCDSSFFIRQLIPGPDRAESIDIAHKMIERFGAIPVSNFTRFEVIQALRFEAWRNKNDRAQGLPAQQVEAALNLFLGEIGGSFALTSPDFEKVLAQAESLSRSTSEKGWRTVDLLHVASAIALQASEFFSFDKQQNELAQEHQMRTPLFR